jgi:hypothetical protein
VIPECKSHSFESLYTNLRADNLPFGGCRKASEAYIEFGQYLLEMLREKRRNMVEDPTNASFLGEYLLKPLEDSN